jgi:hypothetical protein
MVGVDSSVRRALSSGRIATVTGALALSLLALPTVAVAQRAPAVHESSTRSGGCTIVGTPGDDVLRGGPGRDVICGRGGDDRLLGGGGADVLRGGSGNDVLRGAAGADTLAGGPGADLLRGGHGDDVLKGGSGDDTARGGHGEDSVEGGDGNDRLLGGPENDTLRALDGASFHDVLACGSGKGDRADADLADLVAANCEINSQDVAPVAVDDHVTATEDTRLDVPMSGSASPLANDTDADGDTLTITGVSGAVGGTVAIQAGAIRFTPAANLCGATAGHFDYAVSDGKGGTDTGRVIVQITCVADDPVAADDSGMVPEDAAATPLLVLQNDSDADGDALHIGGTTAPAHGTVATTGGGTGLTYQPDADYCGPDSFTYTLTPGGSQATVSVLVVCSDDAPVAVDDSATVDQDDPATAIDVLANDTDVDAGPMTIASATDPANGTVVLTGGSPGARTGLTYQPDPSYCNDPPGTTLDTFDYVLNGGSTATVSVTVTCPDQPPTAVGDSATVDEDAAATAIDVLANDSNADGGPMAIASAGDPAHGTVVLTGGAPGASTGLTYQPAANFCGTDTFTYTLTPGSASATVTVTVTCVDDPPTAVDDVGTTDEDTPLVVAAPGVLANDVDVEGDPITVSTATDPSHGALVHGADGSYTYTPAADYCGTDSFDYTINGGSTATVDLTVNCVVDVPTVTSSAGPTTYTENAAPVAVDPGVSIANPDGVTITSASVTITTNAAAGDALDWTDNDLTDGISEGASTSTTVELAGDGTAAEYAAAMRAVTYVSSSDDPAAAARTVTFTITAGSSTPSDTIELDVTPVDDAPVPVADSATVLEDAAATAVPVLANDTDVDGGPKTIASASDPVNGTVVLTGGSPGARTGLTYQPDPNYCNDPPGTAVDTFTYTLNGGSTATVSMTVTCVNDAPVADDETFNATDSAVGNTALVVNDPTDGAPALSTPKKSITGDILAGDTDVDGPDALAVTPGTFATNDGGSVTLEADGDFVFTPAAATSCTDTSDFFDYTVADGGGGTDVGRVTIAITGCVWYVSNSAAGNSGTSTAPFDTLAQAETASATGDTIYLYDGDNTTTGYAAGLDLKANQRLIGEVAPLVVGSDTLAPGVPGNRPTITDNNTDVVVLAAGNTVRGVQIDPSGTGGGIAGGAGDLGGTIDDVRIIDTGTAGSQPALELNGTSGSFTVSDLTVDNSAATGPAATSVGVLLNNAGTVNFASTGTISLTTKGAKALDATGTSLGGGSVLDDVTVTGSGSGGVSMSGTTGTTTFGALSLTTTSGATAAFALSNAGTVTVSAAGTANIDATGGPAVAVTGTSGPTLAFDSVSSTGSSGDAINLDSLGTGTFTATAGTLAGYTGTAFDLNGGSGSVTYPGTINNGAGATADITGRTGGVVSLSGSINDTNDVGGGITMSGNTGGSTVFTGATKKLDTGTSDAVVIGTSDGHTVVFAGGGLDIDTTTGKGLQATASGVLQVSGSGNTIDSGSGRALNITTTDIAVNDATFQRISSSGAASGILLDTTGSAGNLVVTGLGGTCTNADTSGCSGGNISSPTGADDSTSTPVGTGIVLKDTAAPSLSHMWIHGASNYAIRGTNVAGFAMDTSVINGVNGTNGTTPYDDSSVWFDNLTGSAAVSTSYVGGGLEDNFRVFNSSGSLNRLTLSGVTVGDNNATLGNDGVSLESSGSATVFNATVQNSTFTGAEGDLLAFQHNASGTGDLVLNANAFSNNHPGIATGGGGLSLFSNGAGGNATMTITGNTFRDAVGPGILIVKTTGTATQTGTFSGNTIGVSGVANSGSAEGSALKLQSVGQGTLTWAVTNNTIHQYNNNGVEVLAGGSAAAQSGAVNTTITGNTIDQPGTTPGTITIPKNGVHLNIGTVPGDTYAACAVIGGAGALANTLSASGLDGNPATGLGDVDVRLRQRQNTTIRLPGYPGANGDTTAVQNFVAANNGSGGTPAVLAGASGTGGGFTGTGTTCP